MFEYSIRYRYVISKMYLLTYTMYVFGRLINNIMKCSDIFSYWIFSILYSKGQWLSGQTYVLHIKIVVMVKKKLYNLYIPHQMQFLFLKTKKYRGFSFFLFFFVARGEMYWFKLLVQNSQKHFIRKTQNYKCLKSWLQIQNT